MMTDDEKKAMQENKDKFMQNFADMLERLRTDDTVHLIVMLATHIEEGDDQNTENMGVTMFTNSDDKIAAAVAVNNISASIVLQAQAEDNDAPRH